MHRLNLGDRSLSLTPLSAELALVQIIAHAASAHVFRSSQTAINLESAPKGDPGVSVQHQPESRRLHVRKASHNLLPLTFSGSSGQQRMLPPCVLKSVTLALYATILPWRHRAWN